MGLFSGITGLLGGIFSSDEQEEAYKRAAEMAKFDPYNVSNPLGSATFNGGALSTSLSPEFQAQLQNQLALAGQAYGGYQNFNPQNYAQNMYQTLTAYRAPEQAMRNQNMLQDLYSSGQWGSTPGEASLYSYQNQQDLNDQLLRLQAQSAGAQEQDRLFNLYTNALTGAQNTALAPLQFGTLGANLGQMKAQAGARQGEFLTGAADIAANRTSQLWNSIGQIGDSALGAFGGGMKNFKLGNFNASFGNGGFNIGYGRNN